jgi:hypothetical protein
MHGGAVLLIAVFQNLTMGVQAGIFRQQEGWIFSRRPAKCSTNAGLRIRI